MKSLIRFRNFLYDSGFADTVKIKKPVISVGNLSMGGTGKTPVVLELLQRSLEKNLKPVVIARNYKAKSKVVEKVNTERRMAAQYFGDEAMLVADTFPGVPVFTGPKKYQTAQAAEKQEAFDFLLVDDGFQHRALHRDFDFVLIDASRPLSENQLFPKGRLREDFLSLKRADLVALTKVNWASPENLDNLRQQIARVTDCEICEIQFHQHLGEPLPAGSPVISLAGIANPEVFERNLQGMGMSVVKSFRFADHFAYSNQDAERLLKEMLAVGATKIATTEKDFVKLAEFPDLVSVLTPLKLRLQFNEEPKGLDAFLDHCSRQ
jgi:tetraacyldisaccharide 4'-kinase